MWKQRAEGVWYKRGDKNTKYYHAYANQRMKKNFIKCISFDTNQICEMKEVIDEAFRA